MDPTLFGFAPHSLRHKVKSANTKWGGREVLVCGVSESYELFFSPEK